ncbi:MAG: hypothetical protein QGH70_14080, partial [Nitrospinota bacterium]|nr:hypothetical protein [Nitrospinota bacterium]
MRGLGEGPPEGWGGEAGSIRPSPDGGTFYLDTASADSISLGCAVERAGAEQVVFGTDFPYLPSGPALDAVSGLKNLPMSER